MPRGTRNVRKANHDNTELDATFIAKTRLAYLFDFGTKEGNIWIPRSQCEITDVADIDLRRGMGVTVEMSEAYAVDRGCV